MAIEPLIATTAALTAGFVVNLLRDFLQSQRESEISPSERPYAERLSELTGSLAKASKDVDKILQEMSSVTVVRQANVKKLEQELDGLSAKEAELKQRIQDLQNVPIPVAEHLAKLLQPGEERSAKRDYILFAAGVVTSTVAAVVLKRIGWG